MTLHTSYELALSCLNLTDENKNLYPIWNWLIYKLNNYVWYSMGNNEEDDIWEEIGENNIYRLWLNVIVRALEETFNDANNERVYKCLINCPDEHVAKIIYEATPVIIQNGFVEYNNNIVFYDNKKFDSDSDTDCDTDSDTDIESDGYKILAV